MVKRVLFPKFDANITEGMIGKWRKAESDDVRPGEPLVEIITDKASFELEADCEGKLLKIIANEKSQVPVGFVIALIGDEDEPLPDVSEENALTMQRHRESVLLRKPPTPGLGRGGPRGKKVRATPAARRIAREAGIDISSVPLPEGKSVIEHEDVELYLRKRAKGGT